MNNQNVQEKPDLQTTLEALREGENGTITSTVYYGLSGLTREEVAQFVPVWASLNADYKHTVLRELLDTSETNFELEYSAVANAALEDENGSVRAAAVDLLWEDSSLSTMRRLLTIVRTDQAAAVRASALSALGRFILLDELGEIEEGITADAQALALQIYHDESEPVDVRRRALEAVANCGNTAVPDAIQLAYRSNERLMRVSAVFAMGRTYDDRWKNEVMRELKSDDPEMRYEAARAAGEIELRSALPILGRMAFENDPEIRDIAIWSLGEIGGDDAMRVLNKVAQDAEESGDEDLLEAAEEALHNASLGGDGWLMMDMNADDED